MILIDAEGVSASLPERPLFADVSLTLSDGDRIGLVGLNGSGKTTLLRVLAGELAPDRGTVRRGRGVRVGMLAQLPVLPPGSVGEAVGAGWRGEAMLDRLGMADLVAASTDELSGGQRKRVALAALLAHDWDALVLDEPTNHLDLDAIAYLEQWLADFRGGLLLVTHDRHVLDRVTTKVLELDRGRAYLHQPSGWSAGSGYAAYLAGRSEREENAAADEQARRNLARRELAWLRRGAPARSTKPKARVDAARAVLQQRSPAAARDGDLDLALGSQRLGSKGIELHGVGYSWLPGKPVFAPIDQTLEPGDRLGIVGPNGAGKSTLLDLIAGRLQPTVGAVERGRTVKIGYYDQLGRELDPSQRVRDAVAGDKGTPSVADIGLMRSFWFDGDIQYAPISTLSGGERRRLQLLLTLVEQPNVLLLDEPTNDLDLDTLRALEEFLDDWPGIAVVVSHDRVFLDRTVTKILAFDGSGSARVVRGGVAGWLRERARRTSPTRASETRSVHPTGEAAPSRPARPRPSTKSPSTMRRQLGAAERELAQRVEDRDRLAARLAEEGHDHVQLGRLSVELADAQAEVVRAEEAWLTLAGEAEGSGVQI